MKLPRKSNPFYLTLLLVAVAAVLFMTYDMVVTNLLALYYCKIAPPHPKTKIVKKVEYPLSIYWEDNVYPGFSKEDRELMIINYLDGKHLKTMALNDPDGKRVYVYRLNKPIIDKLKAKYTKSEWYRKGLKEYARLIMQTEKIYTKATMPKLNYTVTFNEVKLPKFARKFLYSDETKVTENETNQTIAYNRRYMRFFYKLQPDFVGGRYYYPHAVCGYSFYRDFDELVFPSLKYMFGGEVTNQKGLNEILYERHIKQGGE